MFLKKDGAIIGRYIRIRFFGRKGPQALSGEYCGEIEPQWCRNKPCRWPKVKSYAEIGAATAKKIKSVIKDLKIDGPELGNTNLVEIFGRPGQSGKDAMDLRFNKASF